MAERDPELDQREESLRYRVAWVILQALVKYDANAQQDLDDAKAAVEELLRSTERSDSDTGVDGGA